MIKRGNGLSSVLTYSPSEPVFTSIFPGYESSPQYETIADRIERIKVQQKQKKQQQIFQIQSRIQEKRQPVLSEYQELQSKNHQYSSPIPKLSHNQSQQFIIHSSSMKNLLLQEDRPIRRSVESKPIRTNSMTRNPQIQSSLLRSSSMGRFKKQQFSNQVLSSIKINFPSADKSLPTSCTFLDLDSQMQKQKQKKVTPYFLRKPLVAGRIYCKQQLMRHDKQPSSKIRRIPINNLNINNRR